MSANTFSFHLECIATPIGDMLVVADEQDRLRALGWADLEERLKRQLTSRYGNLQLRSQPVSTSIRNGLLAYLEGKLDAIDAIPVESGGTAFQRSVWEQLRRIPAGTTMSYGDFAARIGRPKAVRAVGHANGANPICIVVPCHRLIGADGSLTGYGGGLPRKRWLLDHEAAAQGRLI
ncbi:methylated-DNA--[protein]-cysteine S-methyltransferase [Steroidobacter cummioxidans]|uniref:methylated-DNA--[protein]-cysteine S-methyltransferase n=1 Tax=Steroidobacter cummioxidans TaxID=1803913 RepID=UPI000E31F7FA|nr:methylated-DNA--[protein]-cysteine S-methyltransferase [Steroidobacter cummioxidans]